MAKLLKIILAQADFLVGDIENNAAKIIRLATEAKNDLAADLILFPELALTGYPPDDLLLRPECQQRVDTAIKTICSAVTNIDMVIGCPQQQVDKLFNSALWIRDGRVIAQYNKRLLPNYSVFDEKRYFQADDSHCVVTLKDVPIAIMICEDIWTADAVTRAKEAGAQLVLSLNASPFDISKPGLRKDILRQRIKETGLPMVYCNLIGGQDELVFDGGSFVMNSKGELTHQGSYFTENCLPVEFSIDKLPTPISTSLPHELSDKAKIYQALVLGVRDYVQKNHFKGVVIGLSGGIDSALTLTIAVDAIGADNVEAVLMPSCYTSQISIDDAIQQSEALGA